MDLDAYLAHTANQITCQNHEKNKQDNADTPQVSSLPTRVQVAEKYLDQTQKSLEDFRQNHPEVMQHLTGWLTNESLQHVGISDITQRCLLQSAKMGLPGIKFLRHVVSHKSNNELEVDMLIRIATCENYDLASHAVHALGRVKPHSTGNICAMKAVHRIIRERSTAYPDAMIGNINTLIHEGLDPENDNDINPNGELVDLLLTAVFASIHMSLNQLGRISERLETLLVDEVPLFANIDQLQDFIQRFPSSRELLRDVPDTDDFSLEEIQALTENQEPGVEAITARILLVQILQSNINGTMGSSEAHRDLQLLLQTKDQTVQGIVEEILQQSPTSSNTRLQHLLADLGSAKIVGPDECTDEICNALKQWQAEPCDHLLPCMIRLVEASQSSTHLPFAHIRRLVREILFSIHPKYVYLLNRLLAWMNPMDPQWTDDVEGDWDLIRCDILRNSAVFLPFVTHERFPIEIRMQVLEAVTVLLRMQDQVIKISDSQRMWDRLMDRAAGRSARPTCDAKNDFKKWLQQQLSQMAESINAYATGNIGEDKLTKSLQAIKHQAIVASMKNIAYGLFDTFEQIPSDIQEAIGVYVDVGRDLLLHTSPMKRAQLEGHIYQLIETHSTVLPANEIIEIWIALGLVKESFLSQYHRLQISIQGIGKLFALARTQEKQPGETSRQTTILDTALRAEAAKWIRLRPAGELEVYA